MKRRRREYELCWCVFSEWGRSPIYRGWDRGGERILKSQVEEEQTEKQLLASTHDLRK